MCILCTPRVKRNPGPLKTALKSTASFKQKAPDAEEDEGRNHELWSAPSGVTQAAGFTQQELANEVRTSRRVIAYYEGQTAHPPTTLLPAIATALRITTDELLGQAPVKRIAKSRDTRLERRLQQIERLDPTERRQIMQVIDAFIERGT